MVVDLETNTVVDTASMRFGAWGVEATPDGSFVYVTHAGFNTVSVIETEFNTVVTEVPVGMAGTIPLGIAMAPDGAFAYTANFGSVFPRVPGSVSVIETAANTVVAKVDNVGLGPTGIAVTPDGAFAYVTNARQGGNSVSVIETATNSIAATIPLPNWPQRVAITPDGAFAYVTNLRSLAVSVIDTRSNTVVDEVRVHGAQRGVAVTPDGAFVYVTNRDLNTVSVIETATNTHVATVSGVGHQPESVEISLDGAFAYVAAAASLEVISTATNQVVASVVIANGPNDIALTPPLPVSPSLSALIDQVQDLIDGGTLNGAGNGLLSLLNQVLASLAAESPRAIPQLNAFISAVQGMVRSGLLTSGQGQALIDAAQRIVEKLTPPPPPSCEPPLCV